MVMCAMCHHEVRGTCSQEEGSLQVVFSPLKWQPWKIPTIWLCSKNFEWGRRRLSLSSNSQCAPWRLMKIYFPYFGWLRPLSYSACADPRMQPVKVSLVDGGHSLKISGPCMLERYVQIFVSLQAGWASSSFEYEVAVSFLLSYNLYHAKNHSHPKPASYSSPADYLSFFSMVRQHLLSLDGVAAPPLLSQWCDCTSLSLLNGAAAPPLRVLNGAVAPLSSLLMVWLHFSLLSQSISITLPLSTSDHPILSFQKPILFPTLSIFPFFLCQTALVSFCSGNDLLAISCTEEGQLFIPFHF